MIPQAALKQMMDKVADAVDNKKADLADYCLRTYFPRLVDELRKAGGVKPAPVDVEDDSIIVGTTAPKRSKKPAKRKAAKR